jgi:hypothetical protein
MTLTRTAVESSLNNKTGMINVNANTNLEENVVIVACQISFVVCMFSDSSET